MRNAELVELRTEMAELKSDLEEMKERQNSLITGTPAGGEKLTIGVPERRG